MKKILSLLVALALCVLCVPAMAQTEVVVFAAASMTESLNEIAEMYKTVMPDIQLIFNFDSSGTLKTQIAAGADVDLFISAGQKQMNELDITADPTVNTEKLDMVVVDTRFDLLSNTVVLVVPKGAAGGIVSFEDAATDKINLMALGNSDVPVGQYAQEILTYLGIWDKLNVDGKITFASNVKEVLSQVAAAAVDCGIVYVSDAIASDDVEIAAFAPVGSHRPVNYPAAMLKNSMQSQAARAFLEYLKGKECAAVFEKIGFGVTEH